MSTARTYRSATEKPEGSPYTLPAILGGLVLLVFLVVWLMRGSEQLQTGYGQRLGNENRASVNGTLAFSEMFRNAGHSVTSLDKLSPRLRKYQTIVWFPDDFGVPTLEQRQFIENWLAESSGRTLIYVGRDYDAATAYWSQIQPQAPADQAVEIRRKLADAKSRFATQRAMLPKDKFGGWFVLRDGPPRKVTALQGEWAEGIDPLKADIRIASQLVEPTEKDVTSNQGTPPETFEPLLESDGDVIIARVSGNAFGGGQIIVVANGSTLLNYPLINHEHRKLAGRLIAESDPLGDVAFLESGEGGPRVEHRHLAKVNSEWPFPMNAIVFHLVMLAMVYCLARSAIFGRARRLIGDTPTDFGKHITALGKLMQRTKDQSYAYARLQQYRQHGKRDSGKAHKK
ncbi:hypothetical protein ETAA8_43060 [Anatilimnocola aggregata]|uniref:DUF4350 domain-containing protein n=1 Tax=Anatilimnocola aggregata TaxID=2528021 RepID=A0A517YG60_9BACT|nr:DUF4350 domain-containing protein [Anatilimnocola aggregata]QDU29199.1 hypothetical protein ETAA8_43060 [Anatilimnocola aggregata]